MNKVRSGVWLLARHLGAASWRVKLGVGIGVLLGGVVLAQLVYPSDRLLPFTRIDGVALGGITKQEAAARLDKLYGSYQVAIYMGSEKKPVTITKLSDADISVNNTNRLKNLSYPWYLRLVPFSVVWITVQPKLPDPTATFGDTFAQFVEKKLMSSCRQEPVNASLKFDSSQLIVVPAKVGGQCEQAAVTKSISSIKPLLTRPADIRVARQELPAVVGDDKAQQLKSILNERLGDGVLLVVAGDTVSITNKDIMSWLSFAVVDGQLLARVDAETAGKWLSSNAAVKLAVAPGVSYITTRDFDIVSQTTGSNGQAMNIAATVSSIQQVVDGASDQAVAASVVVPPTEQYTRTYSSSDTALGALLANYAHDHAGAFGITLIELDGKKRRADYNGDKQFVTASTYKLFVAYSLLKQIDAGKRDWASNSDCFNKMIVYSDNACAEKFLNSLGLSNVTKDINAIGLKNSNFTKSGGPFTTANDLALLLGMLQSGQNFSPDNRLRLISAMTANVYRKGIPAGANGTVADKVGFMDALLHDAAIVYSPSGTYVLVIMSDGSSWATIADLSSQVDTLRAR